MATFTLTVGADTVVGGAADDTVNGSAATLYAGDNLTGGAGTDVLALYGSGTFRIDQLAAFSGFESITLNNFTNGSASLYLGNQPIEVTGYGTGQEQLFLGSGAVTFHGGNGYNGVFSTSASNWNAGNVINGSSQNGFSSSYLYLNSTGPANAFYDLTTNTLTDINSLYGGYQQNLTLKINSAVAVGVANFSGQAANAQLVTSDTALDLSHSKVAGFAVASTNAAGTTFSVQDVGTAFQIVGGAGQDTITAQGFVFTPAQRDAIFATASVEKIIDQSGTYTAPPPNPNVFTLTVGADTVVGGAADDTVNGTAATLYAGDNLTGGAGTDVLALYGSGTFRIDQLAAFSGFESITLNNFTNGSASLYLGNQPIEVTGYGTGQEQLFLGSGAVTFHGGNGYNGVFSTSASNWNAGNVINGSSQNGFSSSYLYLNSTGPANAFYDLTTNTLTDINSLYGGYQQNLTLKINSAVAVGVANFSGQAANAQLVTSDTALDLSHSKVAGFAVASTNAAGTTFSVQDVGTAFQIVGGAGQDTITTQGFVFTPAQRDAIFATASIEKIIDQSGTYTINTNDAPVLANAIADQGAHSDELFSFQVPANTFSEPDGDTLTYAATLDNGDALPSWLSFNPSTRTFTGTPPHNLAATIDLKVTASDGTLAASDTFTLVITTQNDPPINGTPGADMLNGNGGDLIHGLGGNDTITGNGTFNAAFGDDGNDQLYFAGDQNQLYGGSDNDWLGVNGTNNALVGGSGDEVWIGASGNHNTLDGQDGHDALFVNGIGNNAYGGDGNDWVGGSGTGNTLRGGAGSDWMGVTGSSNAMYGGQGGDTLLSIGSNILIGEDGNDWVGCSGNGNFLAGMAGDDWIGASGNNNILDGGVGNDQLVAGGVHSGNRFVFHAGYGMDTITNFSCHGAGGTDVIDLNGFGLNFATLQTYYMVDGPNAMIVIDAATTLTINGTTKGQLQADDFIF